MIDELCTMDLYMKQFICCVGECKHKYNCYEFTYCIGIIVDMYVRYVTFLPVVGQSCLTRR